VRRLGALLAAALMITVAIWGRGQLDDKTSTPSSEPSASLGVLVCATELQAACETLAGRHHDLTVRIEEAQVTLSRLAAPAFDPATASGDARIDAWLVPQPWPAMMAEQRQRAGSGGVVLDDPGAILARSPLVIAIWNDRRDALVARCGGGTVTWKCIGEVAGTPWGSTSPLDTWGAVKPGHPDPDQTAAGLLALGEATAGWFGTASFASNDFNDPAFRAWFERLERSVPSFPAPPRTPLDAMLFAGPSSFDLTGSTEAAAGPAISTSRDKDRLSILYPAPLTTADVVLAPVAGSQAGGRLMKLMQSKEGAEALAEAGWRVDGQAPAGGVPAEPALAADSNVPRAGVLQALRSLWTEVVR
jgi:hypothetical protein